MDINERNQNREFSLQVRKQEKIAANYACRICGITKNQLPLQLAHIYTLSLNSHWKRTGTDQHKWSDDHYVKSYSNALLLCIHHHKKIDSEEGLINCSVSYLESLKTDLTTCTALIFSKNTYRRCQVKTNHYRCHHHPSGGKEESFLVRNTFGYNPQHYNPTNPLRDTIKSTKNKSFKSTENSSTNKKSTKSTDKKSTKSKPKRHKSTKQKSECIIV